MSVQVEKLEKNMAKLTVEVPAEEVEKALQAAYMKEKNKISIPGFRKGKVPRAMIEKMYGAAVFYEEAANILIQDNYAAAMEESKEDIVSRPTIDIVQIESGKPFIFTAEVAVRPEVTLGKYKGVQVTKIDTTVTDEEVEAALEKEQQKNSRTVTVTDRPVANGDTAVIDFEGFVDGIAFEGGKGENHPLEIGSHSFIDTFEDQLVGHNAGDEVEVNVTFPEKYQAADLAGKPAVFKVKINEIKAKELPELNDEFASEVSEFDTLAEYKEDLRKHLEVEKENEAKRTKEDEAIKKIIDKSTMEIPEAMIETQCENMINEFAQRIAQSGLSMEQYMQFSGMTIDGLKEQVRPEAETRIKSSLVLEQIAKEENIEVSEDEINAEVEKMAAQYGMEADKLKEYLGEAEKESIKRDLSVTKAVDLIMENVKERAKAKTKKEKEAETVTLHTEVNITREYVKPEIPSAKVLYKKTCPEMVRYKIRGRNKDTKRLCTVRKIALASADQNSVIAATGLYDVQSCEVIPPEPATERQISYAADLGIVHPEQYSKDEISCLITRAKNDTDRDDMTSVDVSLARMAADRDIYLSVFSGEKGVLDSLWRQFTEEEKMQFLIFCIHQNLLGKRDYDLAHSPFLDLYDRFVNEYRADEQMHRSLMRYTGSDLSLQKAPNVNRNAYRIVRDYLNK